MPLFWNQFLNNATLSSSIYLYREITDELTPISHPSKVKCMNVRHNLWTVPSLLTDERLVVVFSYFFALHSRHAALLFRKSVGHPCVRPFCLDKDGWAVCGPLPTMSDTVFPVQLSATCYSLNQWIEFEKQVILSDLAQSANASRIGWKFLKKI